MPTHRVSSRQNRFLLIFSLMVTAISASPVSARVPDQYASGGNSQGYDMAPETRLEVVQAAVAALPASKVQGPFQANWNSLKKNYQVPAWFNEAKFGIFMHWGLYSVPAHHNEWYEKHMYGADRQWHATHFGDQEKFGYKDFIPMFRQEKFDPDAWASLLKKSGARFVIPSAQHHDNFAMWDSAVTRFNAKQMGPGRDLIGELAKSVRAQGLKFGVSNHGIENFQFINPPADLAARLKAKKADLYDPEWADFYNVADRSDEACKKFLVDWYLRNVELIDKYQPDMLWFDNGIDQRYLDPLKLQIAAYYYNRASQWGKEVSLSTKKAAYSPSNQNTETIASIIDFEKIGERSPSGIRPGAWQVDEPIGSTWGYTEGMKIASPASIIAKLADTVSKNGTLLLNISPRADGSIPQEQQDTLLGIGQWLAANGEAIYGTHSWTSFGTGGGRNEAGPHIRFTVKEDKLYAIIIGAKPGVELLIAPLSTTIVKEKISQTSLLGKAENLAFVHDQAGLRLQMPQNLPASPAYTLKITGLKMNPSSVTRSGNPAW